MCLALMIVIIQTVSVSARATRDAISLTQDAELVIDAPHKLASPEPEPDLPEITLQSLALARQNAKQQQLKINERAAAALMPAPQKPKLQRIPSTPDLPLITTCHDDSTGYFKCEVIND
mgnify:CR=1 FL=1